MEKLSTFFCSVILLIVMATSCIKEGDFDSGDIKMQPTFALPVLNSSLSMENLLDITGGISPNDIIEIQYTNDGIWLHYKADTTSYNKETPILISGTTEVEIPITGSYDISEFFVNEKGGEIILDSAMLELFLRVNKQGLDVEITNISLNLVTQNNQRVPVPFPTSIPVGEMQQGVYQNILKQSGEGSLNIGRLYSEYEPVRIEYSFNVKTTFNAQAGTTASINIDIAPSLRVLMQGWAKKFAYGDTIDFSLGFDDLNEMDGKSKVVLHFDFQNSFPFDVDVQLYLLDSAMVVRDSLFDRSNLVVSAPIDPTTKTSVGYGKSSPDITLSVAKLKRISNLKKAIFAGSFSTANSIDPSKPKVKILPANRLKLRMALEATVDSEDILGF